MSSSGIPGKDTQTSPKENFQLRFPHTVVFPGQNLEETPDHHSDTASRRLMVLQPYLKAWFRSLF